MSASDQERFLDVVAEALGVNRATLTLDTRRDQVEQWDSLNHLMLFMALEGAFGVRFGTDDLDQYTSLSQIFKKIEAA